MFTRRAKFMKAIAAYIAIVAAGLTFAIVGCGPDADKDPEPDTTAPAAVSDLVAGSPSQTTILVLWTAPGGDGNAGRAALYEIRYATVNIDQANWADAQLVAQPPQPRPCGSGEGLVIGGLSQGTRYYVALVAVDEAGNRSPISNVASIWTRGGTEPIDEIPPAAIDDLNAQTASGNAINLFWLAPGDDGDTGTAFRYEIRYATTPITAANWGQATLVSGYLPPPRPSGHDESSVVSALEGGTTYHFAIMTFDEHDNASPLSNCPAATTSGEPSGPSQVTDLHATAGTNSVSLTWTAPADNGGTIPASAYDIRWSHNPVTTEAAWNAATQVSGEPQPGAPGHGETMSLTGRSTGTYYFCLKSVDEVGHWSAMSNSPNATVVAGCDPPDAVGDLRVASLGVWFATANLVWTAPSVPNGVLASEYEIRYSTSPINEINWSAGTLVTSPPRPGDSGRPDSTSVEGLEHGTTYHFAIRSRSTTDCWSAISNDLTVTTHSVPDPLPGWTALPSALESVLIQGEVAGVWIKHLAVVGSQLFAAGALKVPGHSERGLAMWDGAAWHPVVDMSSVTAMTNFQDNLIVAGSPAGVGPGRIGRWDGSRWETIGILSGGYDVNQFLEFDGKLVVLGNFNSVNGTACQYAAQWDGATWTPLASGLPSWARCGVVFDGAIFVSTNNHGFRRWNGSYWSTFSNETDFAVSMTVHQGQLIAAFCDHDGDGIDMAYRIKGWNGTSWIAFGQSYAGAIACASVSGRLVAVGVDFIVGYVKTWNGSDWDVSAGALVNRSDFGIMNCIAAYDTGYLVGGWFDDLGGGLQAHSIARWNP